MNHIITQLSPLLKKVFFSNSVENYLLSLMFFILLVLILIITNNVLFTRLKQEFAKTKNTLDDFILALVEKQIFPLIYYGAFYLSIRNLKIASSISRIISVIGNVLVIFAMITITTRLIKFWLTKKAAEDTETSKNAAYLSKLIPFLNFIVWLVGGIFLLDNIGFNISAVITGLGIGGVAVAMASQTILGELFSYASILFDKPFEPGDFIIIDSYMGVVDKIGLKTTRIRSLSGEQLVFSNTDLIKARIQNYKRMQERRVVFTLGILYTTSIEQVKQLNTAIREIIVSITETRFDRSHFKAFGDSALVFEVVYYVINPDYTIYMDIQQEINLKIFEYMQAQGIGFAYPTQTVYIAQ